MTQERGPPREQADATESRSAAKSDARQDRLKQALRDNLKRRKSQARGRVADAQPSSDADRTADPD